jgi:D-glycero-alpha-D-manno-heptose-7-phosphate kinase
VVVNPNILRRSEPAAWTRCWHDPVYDPPVIVTASAPIRVCDCGGWTDTWFARYGRVLSIAVRPCATVQVRVYSPGSGRPPVFIVADDLGDRYAPAPAGARWDRHPLLEAAIESMPMPDGVSIEVSIACDVPAGASTGTSAAVTVALLGALDRARGGSLSPREIARAAHAVETDRLGQQSGIQDQIGSAVGGVNDIEMTEYPEATVRRLSVPAAARWDLERRLALILLGRGHRSTLVHERVIERLAGSGPSSPELDALRGAAARACDAVQSGDLEALGRAMADNTEGQRRLHPDLVCRDAERVIEIARDHGAAGWKVNGAGGDGGSLTLLGPSSLEAHRSMLRAIHAESSAFRQMPITLDDAGLRVWTDDLAPSGS